LVFTFIDTVVTFIDTVVTSIDTVVTSIDTVVASIDTRGGVSPRAVPKLPLKHPSWLLAVRPLAS
jgi:hypothetical protein